MQTGWPELPPFVNIFLKAIKGSTGNYAYGKWKWENVQMEILEAHICMQYIYTDTGGPTPARGKYTFQQPPPHPQL